MNSCQKGKRGEREWAAWLREYLGVLAARGRQHSGSPDSPDVISEIDVHFEVKRTERLSLYEAIGQAIRNAGERVPVVVHRRSRDEWLLVIRASDVVRFARAILRV
jgi:Holliday junction resolvase